jgi:hypothetical protein
MIIDCEQNIGVDNQSLFVLYLYVFRDVYNNHDDYEKIFNQSHIV